MGTGGGGGRGHCEVEIATDADVTDETTVPDRLRPVREVFAVVVLARGGRVPSPLLTPAPDPNLFLMLLPLTPEEAYP